MVAPVQLAHVVLWTRQVPRMRDWYVKVLDARVAYEKPPALAFLTYDDEHHRIALTDPEGTKELLADSEGGGEGMISVAAATAAPLSPAELAALPAHGMAHMAFTYASLGDLLGNYERLKADSIEPATMINHGVTTSMYYVDPDGNRIELQVDNFGTAEEATALMESEAFDKDPTGKAFDADELLRRLRAGESAAD
ncbi:VOC family protein, partial [Streptomyces sp. 150FB]|uniref:VOC family protein n=1 Tax=Streptomyces sp. 150FB TaxID=1576605 RepID=UPI0007C66B96